MAGASPPGAHWHLPKAFHDKPHMFSLDTAVRAKGDATIPCSKIHLAASSDYFERLFFPSHPTAPQGDKTSTVDLSEFTEQELQFALCFVNNRDASFHAHLPSTFAAAAPLLVRLMVFADRYQVKGLCRAAHAALRPRMSCSFHAAACILEAAGELAVSERPPPVIAWALETVQKGAFRHCQPLDVDEDLYRYRVLLRVPKSVALLVLQSDETVAEEAELYRLAMELAVKHGDAAAFLKHIRLLLLPTEFVKEMRGSRLEEIVGPDRLAALARTGGDASDGRERLPQWVCGVTPERFLPPNYLKTLAVCAASGAEVPLLSNTLASPSRRATARAEGSTAFHSRCQADGTAQALLSTLRGRLEKLGGQGVLDPSAWAVPLTEDAQNLRDHDDPGNYEWQGALDFKGDKAVWCGSIPADCPPSCEVAVGFSVCAFRQDRHEALHQLVLFSSDDTKTRALISPYAPPDTEPAPPRQVLEEYAFRLLQPGCHFRLEVCQLADVQGRLQCTLVVDEPAAELEGLEEGAPPGVHVSFGNDQRFAVTKTLVVPGQGAMWCTVNFYGEVTNGRIVLHGAK